MSTQAPAALAYKIPAKAKIAVIQARFNADITDELLAGCQRRLAELGVKTKQVATFQVPGAFELPVAARWASKDYDAVICLGAVVRGDTPHFDYVAGEAARGIQQVATSTGVPVIFGVLTTNTHKQALQRIGGTHGHAGERAAEAALEMIALKKAI
jgi:6,7-dimethyl-8-ribityllumazine synthase